MPSATIGRLALELGFHSMRRQPYYSIEFASVKLADYDDSATDPNMPAPPNEPLFSMSEPEPGDLP